MKEFLVERECMLTLLADQPECLWDDALPVEVKELPEDLAALDVLLADHEVLWPLVGRWQREFRETGRLVLTEGRPTIALETFVRLMVLKQRYRWGYRTLVAEVSDSIHLRRFCRISLSGLGGSARLGQGGLGHARGRDPAARLRGRQRDRVADDQVVGGTPRGAQPRGRVPGDLARPQQLLELGTRRRETESRLDSLLVLLAAVNAELQRLRGGRRRATRHRRYGSSAPGARKSPMFARRLARTESRSVGGRAAR